MVSHHLFLGLTSGLFHSGFPFNMSRVCFISPTRATSPTHYAVLDLIVLIISGKEYEAYNSSFFSVFPLPLLHCFQIFFLQFFLSLKEG
jgi:hypothetical protein